MYKIVKIKESELKTFKDKIISVISTKELSNPTYDHLGARPYWEWQTELELTCLVEVK